MNEHRGQMEGHPRRWSIGDVQIDGPLVLGPLAGYTSLPLRLLCHRAGANLVCSEMVAARALAHGNVKTLDLLVTCPQERPVVIQLFGGEPDVVAAAVAQVEDAGADVIDINMGCPVPKVRKAGAGAALMADQDRAVAIAAAVVRRASVPVMCKIRAGLFEGDHSFIQMASRLEAVGVAAIALHARTVSQRFTGQADHTLTKRLVEAVGTPVIASGDVVSPSAPARILEDTGCAAVMIARGAIGKPWIFTQASAILAGQDPPPDPSPATRFGIALCQAQMLAGQREEDRAVYQMRGHLVWYTKGMPDAARLRGELSGVGSLAELEGLMREYVQRHGPEPLV